MLFKITFYRSQQIARCNLVRLPFAGGADQVPVGGTGDERNDAVRRVERHPGAKRETTEVRERACGAEQGGGAAKRGVVALHADTRQQGQPQQQPSRHSESSQPAVQQTEQPDHQLQFQQPHVRVFRMGQQRWHVQLGAASQRQAVERAAAPETVEDRAEEGEADAGQGDRGGALVRGSATPAAEDVSGRAAAAGGVSRPAGHHRQPFVPRVRDGEAGQESQADENRAVQSAEEQGQREGEGEGSTVRGQRHLSGLLPRGQGTVAVDVGRLGQLQEVQGGVQEADELLGEDLQVRWDGLRFGPIRVNDCSTNLSLGD